MFSINCREYLKKKTITDYFERARYFYSIEKSDEPKINENWFKKKKRFVHMFSIYPTQK